ncbi:receptor-like protein kinase ANXUR2 [Gastrolobium bilobum]|uniref:receptor-like protein kinase ANXUR2 n=1 Tax=Gastrolobium bilobum TaxID=150636 RepID=UPI002AB136C2|nr:receptor-like protein kinase ANXUR2 [Gastrolobium bilobum]
MLPKYMCFCWSKHTRSSSSSSKKQSPTIIEELCCKFSLEDLRKSTNNFDEKRIIGRGGFGDVYKGHLKHDEGTDYAIALKRMYRKSRQGIMEFKNEIELLCQLCHPNLVSLVGFYDDKNETIIVYDYMANGSLHDRLYCKDMEPLSWKKRLEICIAVAHGLHYLHTGAKRTIFHQNLNLNSILLDNNMVPKITGFGLSLQGPRFIAGTSGYNAPNNTFTVEYDVYSFGVVMLLVICTKDKQTIFDKINRVENQSKELEKFIKVTPATMDIYDLVHRFPVEEMMDPILKGKIAPGCWEVFIDIAERCLKQEPNERPTMGEVEVQLEYGLALQEEADATKTSGDFILLSTTIFNTEPE